MIKECKTILDLLKNQMPELLVVLGPTASGKSDLATNIAKGLKKLNIIESDIINADSYSLYKKMNIGTAKPSQIERDESHTQYNINYYLFDVIDPKQTITVAWYKNEAVKIIQNSIKSGRLPILCGGSGLYIRAVTDGFMFENGVKSPENRNMNQRHRGPDNSLPVYKYAIEKTLQIGINLTRDELDDRIDKRTDNMRDLGLEKEVYNLYNANQLGETAIKAIGYSEFINYFQNMPNPANGKQLTIDDVYDLIKMHTKRLVRRQQSWFNRDPRIKWLNKNEID